MTRIPFYFLTIAMIFTAIMPITVMAQKQQANDILPPIVTDAVPESEILPDVKMQSRTHPEKIIFSQLKLAKKTPDFDAMVIESPRYKKAQDIDKSAIALTEYNRLSNGFNLHDASQSIIIHTQLTVDEYSALQDLVVFDELDETTFFRFKMYGVNVGIVPGNIAQFSKIKMSKARAKAMFSSIGGGKKINAEFLLKPTYADGNTPFAMGDENYWLMFGKIMEVRLWSSNTPEEAQLLWFNRANWYTPKDNNNLGTLYNKN